MYRRKKQYCMHDASIKTFRPCNYSVMLRRQGFQPNIPSGPEHENRLRFFEHHLPTGRPRRKSGMAFMGVNIREPKNTFWGMVLGYDFGVWFGVWFWGMILGCDFGVWCWGMILGYDWGMISGYDFEGRLLFLSHTLFIILWKITTRRSRINIIKYKNFSV